MKKGFKENIEKLTLENNDYRRVIYTAEHSQLVLMTLKPKEEIGFEVHEDNDQFFRFEKGNGAVMINDMTYEVSDGDAVVVLSGSHHNIVNMSDTEDLKLYTIYSPAHHKSGTIHHTKADEVEESFDGETTES